MTTMSVVEMDPLIESLYYWSDIIGVLLMGMIGGTMARQRGYDIVGFFFIAMFSSLGGGMIRDVLINRGTVAAMSQPEYLYLAFTGAIIARFVYFKGKTWDYVQSHGDAVVTALWASTGALKAIAYGLPLIPCIMMGVFTATGGSFLLQLCSLVLQGVDAGWQVLLVGVGVAAEEIGEVRAVAAEQGAAELQEGSRVGRGQLVQRGVRGDTGVGFAVGGSTGVGGCGAVGSRGGCGGVGGGGVSSRGSGCGLSGGGVGGTGDYNCGKCGGNGCAAQGVHGTHRINPFYRCGLSDHG
ncbi:membrane hypothetical protein [Corynebacterium striatum]|nr:membrane hypothetical protein [Corynebacterium striatum]